MKTISHPREHWLLGMLALACLLAPRAQSQIIGIDHMPTPVRDLEKAVSDFSNLGFAIKLIASVIVLLVSARWMGGELYNYTVHLLDTFPLMVR